MRNLSARHWIIALLLLAAAFFVVQSPALKSAKVKPKPTPTQSAPSKASPVMATTETETPAASDTPEVTQVATETLEPLPTFTDTAAPIFTVTEPPTLAPSATSAAPIAPYRAAPACPENGEAHDRTVTHTLWDSARGCHYNHEHGTSPFTPETEAIFAPLGLLKDLLCGLEISHCVPSSPHENTHKHTGHKWQVTQNPNGCAPFAGLQGNVTVGVNYAAIQFHDFSQYFINPDMPSMAEFESRVHSSAAALRQCKPGNPNDFGYIYVEQYQDFGPVLRHYQGPRLDYPLNPPFYPTGLAPYFAGHCVFGTGCRTSLAQALANASTTIWTSSPANVAGSRLFFFLFRGRDASQMVDGTDSTYPYKAYWLCSTDGGLTFNPNIPGGCNKNSTTSFIQELSGEIPAAWDNLAGFDTNPTIGRITATGYVTRFGQLAQGCTAYGPDCQPIKMIDAFVGRYGAHLILDKTDQFKPPSQPERDICFTSAGVLINCDLPGAIPSGWVGAAN